MHVLLNSELEKHKKILDFFSRLPKCLRQYVQSFYMSTLPILLCPECGSGFYKLFKENDSISNCFLCEHNYFQLKFGTTEGLLII